MAVYRRNYKPYAGRLTPEWSRCLVLFRYSRRNLFRSKFLTGLFVVCFFYPLACLLMIYLAHSASFLQQLGLPAGVLTIDNKFFFHFISVQGGFAFILTAFAGPGLISPDLANGALPLYFCRPFSRAEYVLGKSSVLAILLSQITWVPGLVLFAMQAGLAGASWTWSNLWIAGSLIVSSLDLDRNSVFDRDGAFGMGEMENRGRRLAAGRDVLRSGLRAGDQRRNEESSRATSSTSPI